MTGRTPAGPADDDRPADIRRVGVVVPAYNEAASIGGCLRSIAAAAAHCPIPVRVIVVADTCTDDTARIARAAGADVIEVHVRNVGLVRAAGCRDVTGDDPGGLWLAHTDADSTVPPDWLTAQLTYAAAGADVTAGTIRVADWREWPAGLHAAYERYYTSRIARGAHHIHGCNLGLSARAYARVGGFAPLHVGEDHALVAAAREAGLRVAHPQHIPVCTSGRRHARAAAGFHTFLAEMATLTA